MVEFGWDGDCGADNLVCDLEEKLEDLKNSSI